MSYGYSSGRFNGSRLSYAEAVTYLSKARNKWDRPLHGRASTRIIWLGDGVPGADSIALRLYRTVCVVIHPDDTYTINTDGYNTFLTRAFIENYSPARIYNTRVRHKIHKWMTTALQISDKNDTISAPRVWKCRTCKGTGGEPRLAYGQYTGTNYTDYVKFDEPRMLERGCYRCNGEGRVDYGSKPIYTDWDGSWMHVDGDGNIIGAHPDSVSNGFYARTKDQPAWANVAVHKAMATKAAKKPEEPETDYYGYPASSAPQHDVAGTLRALLPELGTPVACPEYNGTQYDCSMARVYEQVVHLNDEHRWTREQIADWLDTLDVDLRFPSAA